MTCVRCVDDDDDDGGGDGDGGDDDGEKEGGEEANVVLASTLPTTHLAPSLCFMLPVPGRRSVVAANNDFLGPRDRV